MSLEKAISLRRSVRSYSDRGLSLQQVSQLLWSVQGVTDKRRGLRASPSAGALYPLEIYIAKSDGLFHYVVNGHSLVRKEEADIRSALSKACLGQSFVAQAPASVIICAVRNRVSGRYGRRGDRYVDIEVGHAAENLHLQAVALGLASVPVGAFDDGSVTKLLGLPEGMEPVYIVPVGYKK